MKVVGRSRMVVVACGVLATALAGLGTAGCDPGPDRGTRPAANARPALSDTEAQPAEESSAAGTQPAQESTGPAPAGAAAPRGQGVRDRKASKGYAAPPANAGFDYQIGGGYPLPAGVSVVSRDHGDSPAGGAYNICYVNGFQTQSEAEGWWKKNHDDLLLKHNGEYVVDENWDEIILDISTSAKRTALTAIVGEWIDECAAKGFQGLEIDNLDTWTRSEGLLTQAHEIAYAKLLAARAHAKGLAVGQKNSVELGGKGRSEVGFDFAIAESCMDYDECDGYTDVYGDHVIVIQYSNSSFREACEKYGAKLSIVRRDQGVSVPGSGSYVFKSC